MKQILELARLNLLQILRDRSELASILILPVMLTLIFGVAFGSEDEGPVRVAFTDSADTPYSREFRSLLAEEKDAFTLQDESAEDARALVEDGEVAAWVEVGWAFGYWHNSYEETSRINVVRDPTSSRALGVAEIVNGAADRMEAGVRAAELASDALGDAREKFEAGPLPGLGGGETAGQSPQSPAGPPEAQRHGGPDLDMIRGVPVRELPSEIRDTLSETFPYLRREPEFDDLYEMADAFWEPEPPVKVVSTAVTPSDVRGDSTTAEGFAQYSLGFTVMFVLFIALGSAGGILEERENGTLQRIMVAPVTKRQILAGKILGVLFTASLEAAILIVLGMVAFDVPWGRDPIALLMVVGAYILCATGFAVLVSALVRTRGQMSSLGTVSAVALAMLGGAYWPIEVVSPVMRRIADFTFTGWAMFGLVDVVARNQGVAAAVMPTLVLLGFAAAFFVLGTALLKFE